MTEAEWLACDDPFPMLEFLRGRASDRKLRLFDAALLRLVPAYRLPEEERLRSATRIELIEEQADYGPFDGPEETGPRRRAPRRTRGSGRRWTRVPW